MNGERSEEDDAILRFYARLGFDPIPETPFMVLGTAYNRPRPGRKPEKDVPLDDDEEDDDLDDQ